MGGIDKRKGKVMEVDQLGSRFSVLEVKDEEKMHGTVIEVFKLKNGLESSDGRSQNINRAGPSKSINMRERESNQVPTIMTKKKNQVLSQTTPSKPTTKGPAAKGKKEMRACLTRLKVIQITETRYL